jgi:hypothetical protein
MADRRIWVLDTDTKGTGARMVPLEDVLERPAAPTRPLRVPPRPRARPPKPPEPRAPRRFRVVDVVSRALLADDVDARTALEVLGRVRSTVDVTVQVLEPRDGSWRLLTRAEQHELWRRRIST